MHRKNDAGHDLNGKKNSAQNTEIPPIIEIARNRIFASDGTINDARQRKPIVDPAHHGVLGFVGLCPGKAHRFCSTPLRQSRP